MCWNTAKELHVEFNIFLAQMTLFRTWLSKLSLLRGFIWWSRNRNYEVSLLYLIRHQDRKIRCNWKQVQNHSILVIFTVRLISIYNWKSCIVDHVKNGTILMVYSTISIITIINIYFSMNLWTMKWTLGTRLRFLNSANGIWLFNEAFQSLVLSRNDKKQIHSNQKQSL